MKRNRKLDIVLATATVSAFAILGPSVEADDKSAVTYRQKCAGCHGADGKGETPAGKAMNVRSFSSPETAKMSDQELADIIEKGKRKMPKYGASLKPDEIKAIVAYVRSLAK